MCLFLGGDKAKYYGLSANCAGCDEEKIAGELNEDPGQKLDCAVLFISESCNQKCISHAKTIISGMFCIKGLSQCTR